MHASHVCLLSAAQRSRMEAQHATNLANVQRAAHLAVQRARDGRTADKVDFERRLEVSLTHGASHGVAYAVVLTPWYRVRCVGVCCSWSARSTCDAA